jgi:hypothetical protein
VRSGRAVEIVLGAGVIAGAALVFVRLSRPAAAATTGSPRDRESIALPPLGGPSPYGDRYRSLLARGRQGEKWRSAMARTAPPGYADADWIDAVVKWIGIESGGDPTNVTGGKEIGLLQINRTYATSQGFTRDELDRYIARATSDDDRSRLSWRYVQQLDKPVPKVAIPDHKAHAWVTYMHHALPLALHELADQGFLVNGPGAETMNAAWEHYRPSDRAKSFATSKVGTPGQQVLLRFVAAADAVAGYDRSARWT